MACIEMGGTPESVIAPTKVYSGGREFLRPHPPSMLGSLGPMHLNLAHFVSALGRLRLSNSSAGEIPAHRLRGPPAGASSAARLFGISRATSPGQRRNRGQFMRVLMPPAAIVAVGV